MEKICPICGRTFIAKRKSTRTCGRSDCQDLLRRKEAGITKICPVCGQEFTPRKYSTREQLTCSRSCGAKYRRQRGHAPPSRRKERVWLTCEYCGEKFQCKRKHKEKTRRFCSRSCAAKARHRANPKLREHLRHKTERARRLSSERMKRNNPMGRPEIRAKVSVALRGRGWLAKVRGGQGAPMPAPQLLLHKITGWPTEYAIPTGNPKWHTAMVDLACPELKIAVECDGLSHNTKRQKSRDRIKDQMLAEKGWLVMRFSNQEILKQTGRVLRRIINAVSQRASQLNT